jgi:hypothetical protein
MTLRCVCGGPISGSPSDDFCSESCQGAWSVANSLRPEDRPDWERLAAMRNEADGMIARRSGPLGAAVPTATPNCTEWLDLPGLYSSDLRQVCSGCGAIRIIRRYPAVNPLRVDAPPGTV